MTAATFSKISLVCLKLNYGRYTHSLTLARMPITSCLSALLGPNTCTLNAPSRSPNKDGMSVLSAKKVNVDQTLTIMVKFKCINLSNDVVWLVKHATHCQEFQVQCPKLLVYHTTAVPLWYLRFCMYL